MSILSFFSKEVKTCPMCVGQFKIEIMRTGGGRFNSSGIGPELRRHYVPTKRYGLIYPLIYNIVVCPRCWYSALPIDFFNEQSYRIKEIKDSEELRRSEVRKLLPGIDLDFKQDRNLELGLSSFFLAIFCYNFYQHPSTGFAHKFLCALRAAWCCDDLKQKNQNDRYDKIGLYFRRLAQNCLDRHIEMMYQHKEKLTEIEYHGPDLDHNYGYDGFIYLNCYLGYLFSDDQKSPKEEFQLLMSYRSRLAKIFGIGKVEASSPSPLKKCARDGYDLIKQKIDLIKEQHPELAK